MIDRARQHDEDAIAVLYQRALPTVYRYVFARVGRPELVDDIVAEVFLAMVEGIKDLRADYEAGFFAWLLRIAQAKIARALQQATKTQTLHTSLPENQEDALYAELAALGTANDPAAVHEWREAVAELGAALGTLSIDQQTVVVGRFLEGHSIEDLARALDKQPGAIRALQFRALGTLAERLGFTRAPRRGSRGGRE